MRIILRARIRHIHDTTEGSTTVYVTHDQEEAVALADRIIVMNHARIQQIGGFDDLWNRPANLFVAGFVGDPPMNILAAEVASESSVRIAGAAIEVPAGQRPARWPASGRVVVGIRPDGLSLTEPTDSAGTIAGTIIVDEYHGDRSIATATIGDVAIKCFADADADLAPGEAVGVHAAADQIVFFDPDSEQALPARSLGG